MFTRNGQPPSVSTRNPKHQKQNTKKPDQSWQKLVQIRPLRAQIQHGKPTYARRIHDLTLRIYGNMTSTEPATFGVQAFGLPYNVAVDLGLEKYLKTYIKTKLADKTDRAILDDCKKIKFISYLP